MALASQRDQCRTITIGIWKGMLALGFILLVRAEGVWAADDERTEPLARSVTEVEKMGESDTSDDSGSDGSFFSHFNMNYFGVFFGPSIKSPSSYQPDTPGVTDTKRPVILKNFLGLNYNIDGQYSAGVTAYWTYRPVLGQQLEMQDPFVRFADNSIFQVGNLNLYGDVRVHLPVSAISRANHLFGGIQTVSALTFEIPDTRLTAALYGSARTNFYGKNGFGNDIEVYLSPNLTYQLSPKVALTLMYEMQASHTFGGKAFSFNNDGTDLQPGVSWDITPTLNVNPYLNITTGGRIGLDTTSIGMLVNWVLI